MIQQEGQGRERGVGRTHVAIADDTPLLRAREQVARSCETFNKLLLHTKRVSRGLELPRQGGLGEQGRTVAIDKANCASFDIGPLSPKGPQ